MPSSVHLFSPSGRIDRKGFVLTFIGLLLVSYAPALVAHFVDLPAPLVYFEIPLFVLLGYVLVCAVAKRLRDVGQSVSHLWLRALVTVPVYALFASPLSALLPVPSPLSTLALIAANGILVFGLIWLCVTPSLSVVETLVPASEPLPEAIPEPEPTDETVPIS